jgi:hypothetical protein
MARVIALMALAALGLTEAPVHEPVHDHHSERLLSTTERYHALREIRLDGRACRSRLRLVARAVIIRRRAWRCFQAARQPAGRLSVTFPAAGLPLPGVPSCGPNTTSLRAVLDRPAPGGSGRGRCQRVMATFRALVSAARPKVS